MRLRFAPSPTGYLHIGNARTAICNYLIAKKTGATLVLRVEDTDMERSTKESETSILHDLRWLGIEWDEGPDKGGDCGPYRQSERFEIYKEYTDKLLAAGNAYHCYCSQEELDAQRAAAEAAGKPFVYPGTCRHLTDEQKRAHEAAGKKPTVRFRVPDNEPIEINDLIKGHVAFNSENIGGDFIIVRSDGTPIYNYIVIIDDTLMKITHVIRGEDHLPNTPKQICIARALGLPVPEYAHLALVLGDDKKKLSKRHGITSVDMYRSEGYLPEALVNYIAMLGWSSESGEEIMPFEKMAEQIEIGSLAKSAAVFDFVKLKWMNSAYIRNMELDKAIALFAPYIEKAGYSLSDFDAAWVSEVMAAIRGNCEILSDIQKIIGIFFDEIFEQDEDAITWLSDDNGKAIIRAAHELIKGEITEENFVAEIVAKIKEKTGLGGKKLFMPVRAMITGRVHGPDMNESLRLIGYKRAVKRIEYAHTKFGA